MPPDQSVEAHHFEAMGTSCSLFAVDLPGSHLLEGEAWVRRTSARLTRFSPESELSRFNGEAGRWFEVSEMLESLLRGALRAYEMSSGLVNAAVLPSMLAIGYVRSLAEGPGVATRESPQPLPALPEVLEVRHGEARLAAGSGIDLGGIAKGLMADRLCRALGPNVVVNLGGDLMATGQGPEGNGWPVGVAGVTLMLREQGAATSSVRKRGWHDLHHLIDPRTGAPAATGLSEVSVVAASGFEAEVVAKTALLLGPELAGTFCASHSLAWWLGSADDD